MSARNELPLPAPLLIDEEQLLAEMPSPGAADLRFTQSHQRAQTQTYLASNLQQGTGRAHQQAPQMNLFFKCCLFHHEWLIKEVHGVALRT